MVRFCNIYDLPLINDPLPSTFSKKFNNCSPRLIFRCKDETDIEESILFTGDAVVISAFDSDGLPYPEIQKAH